MISILHKQLLSQNIYLGIHARPQRQVRLRQADDQRIVCIALLNGCHRRNRSNLATNRLIAKDYNSHICLLPNSDSTDLRLINILRFDKPRGCIDKFEYGRTRVGPFTNLSVDGRYGTIEERMDLEVLPFGSGLWDSGDARRSLCHSQRGIRRTPFCPK